jgi:putative DNA primase/helicase
MEFYWQVRSIPITGNRVLLPEWESPEDPQTRTEEFLKLHKDRFPDALLPAPPPPPPQSTSVLMPDQILSKLFCEHDGEKWAEIYAGNWQVHYESPSDADLALLMKFAFYSGKDRQMMESMFSECPLSKILIRGTVQQPTVWRTPKWASQNYRKRSLDTAILKTTKIYTPPKKTMSAQEFYKLGRHRIHEQRNQK